MDSENYPLYQALNKNKPECQQLRTTVSVLLTLVTHGTANKHLTCVALMLFFKLFREPKCDYYVQEVLLASHVDLVPKIAELLHFTVSTHVQIMQVCIS